MIIYHDIILNNTITNGEYTAIIDNFNTLKNNNQQEYFIILYKLQDKFENGKVIKQYIFTKRQAKILMASCCLDIEESYDFPSCLDGCRLKITIKNSKVIYTEPIPNKYV
ncbi:MAG: hypothetical protein RR136_03220 [Clostridia bacterium]